MGLGNCDNTSDADKPISTAQLTALNGKVDKTTTVNGHSLSGNITVTKGDVGLGNCDNTADLDKPISTATQTALDAKLDVSQLKTSWSSTVSNSNIPSERLVKDSLDTKYVKPSTGIPKTDLETAVQTSLDKADTALQSHQSIKTINSTTMVGTGNINLQVPLVGSGTGQNIKTVGGTNILGTGDINPVTKTAIESALSVSATYNNKALIVMNGVLDFGEAGKVDDVQINGASILSNKIAVIPITVTDVTLADM